MPLPKHYQHVPVVDMTQDFSKALFDKQADYFDVNVVNETRNSTYKRLSKLAAGVGLDEGKIYKQLEISDKPGEDGSLNTGNGTTNDLKSLIKAARLVGIHVSPTVVFNVSSPKNQCIQAALTDPRASSRTASRAASRPSNGMSGCRRMSPDYRKEMRVVTNVGLLRPGSRFFDHVYVMNFSSEHGKFFHLLSCALSPPPLVLLVEELCLVSGRSLILEL